MRLEEYLKEAEDLSATRWEEVIVLSCNKMLKDLEYDSSELLTMSAIKKLPVPADSDYYKVGEEIVKKLQNVLGNNILIHNGANKASTTSFWYDITGKSKDTPKTDLYTSQTNISLKKTGSSQLMSGVEKETMATLYAALDNKNSNDLFKEIIKDVQSNKFLKNVKTSAGIRDIKKGIAGTPKEREFVTDISDFHKQLTDKINAFADTDKEFRINFVKEAMDGEKKFGKGTAIADSIVVFDTTGNARYHKIDKSYVGSIANSIKIRISFKGSKTKTSALRMDYKTKITENTIYDIIDNEYNKLLNESIITEAKIFQSIKNIVTGIVNGLKKVIKKGFKAVMEFLGLEISNVTSTNYTF